MRIRRGIVAVFLLLDAADTVAWLAQVIPDSPALNATALACVMVRGLVASAEAMAAWLLFREEPAARPLAIAGLFGAALLTTLIVGIGLGPSAVPPGARWDVVAAYWIAAVGLTYAVGR
jgi:hypothetical protein